MIAQNVRNIRNQITEVCSRIGRNPEEITLIAVTKTFDTECIREVVSAGVPDIGENYVQEVIQKQQQLEHEQIQWHFIGHLQRNKIKYIMPWVHCIHSVDSLRLGDEISQQAKKLNKTVDILVEVNSTDEQSKFGIKPDMAVELVKQLRQCSHLTVKGLMTIGRFGKPEESRPSFQILRELRNELTHDGIPLPHLSMGMTNDFQVAIEEGATMIRIGTAIFGKRIYHK